MEDNLIFFLNGKGPKLFLKMEDDLIFRKNGIKPNFLLNER